MATGKPIRDRVRWTPEMIEQLREYYGTHTTQESARRFGTTAMAIASVARKNGIKKQVRTCDRIDWNAVIEAMADDVVTVHDIAARLPDMDSGRAYGRLSKMVRENVVEVVSKGGSGVPSKYRLCMPVERAMAIMAPAGSEEMQWSPVALEQAWPARISRGDVYEQVDADYQQSGQEAVCS